jgi:uncharacterized protein (TIGR03000 family)
MSPLQATAQRGGHGGGGHGGGGHGGGGHGGGHAGAAHVGGGGHVGVGHVGGGFNHGNFHGGGFNHGFRGYYPWAFGYYPFGYGYGGLPYYDYGYSYSSPGYYDNGYYDSGYYDSGYNPYPSAPYRSVGSPAPAGPDESSNQAAEIDVLVPRAVSFVWIAAYEMSAGTGTERFFRSPPLQAGFSYTYRVTASWMENGQEVRVQRTVPVASGRRSVVDFSRAQPTLRMPPAPE